MQESANLPAFGRFSFVEHPPSPLVAHLPLLAAPEFAGIADVIGCMLQCSAGARMEAEEGRQVVMRGAGAGGLLLRPVGEGEDGEGGEGVEGFVEQERWERKTLGEWLAPFM